MALSVASRTTRRMGEATTVVCLLLALHAPLLPTVMLHWLAEVAILRDDVSRHHSIVRFCHFLDHEATLDGAPTATADTSHNHVVIAATSH